MKITTIKELREAGDEQINEAMREIHLIPRMQTLLEDMNLEDHCKRLGVFSASDLGNKSGKSLCGKYPMGCARMLYYRYIGTPAEEKIDPRLRRIFGTGHKLHDQIQDYLYKYVRDLKKVSDDGNVETFVAEAEFSPETNHVANKYEIESTTDGVYEISVADGKNSTHIRFGLEIKSMNHDRFTKLNGPEKDNLIQCHVYMACLDLPFMVLLYYDKNDSSWCEFPIVFEDEIWQAVKDKIYFVAECAVDEEPPPREVSFNCRTCRYMYVCKPPKPSHRSVKRSRAAFRIGGPKR